MPNESAQIRKWRELIRKKPLRGYKSRKFANWIRNLYRTKGLGTPFKVEDMLRGCGLDPENRRDYAAAQRFLQKQRKDFYTAMLLFFNSEEFNKYYNDGLSEEELFRKLVEAAVSWNRFPVWSDRDDDRNYKLYDMASYVHLKERRALAIQSEWHRTTDELGYAFDKFPSLPMRYAKPQLERNGTFIALPKGLECEICHEHFSGQKQLVKHYAEKHSDYLAPRERDGEDRPQAGLDALFGKG